MKPVISVIIASYNEEKLLPKCLTSLQKQTYSKDKYEIIVVDNGSSDNTAAIAKQFTQNVYYYDEIQGCGAARNYGFTKSKGSIIVFMDADSSAESEWLEKIVRYFEDKSLICIGGSAMPDNNGSVVRVIFGFYNALFAMHKLIGMPLLWGFNMAIRRKAYETVGGINHKLAGSEDWEFVTRLKKHYGTKTIRYVHDLPTTTSTRKHKKANVFLRYAIDGIRNYFFIVILQKTKSKPIFNVR